MRICDLILRLHDDRVRLADHLVVKQLWDVQEDRQGGMLN
jgi:hypothetical protein